MLTFAETADLISERLVNALRAAQSQPSPDTGIDAQPDRIQLSKNWGLRKLNEGDPKRERWALQYLGMDWLVISEFLPPGKDGVCTIGDELRKFASEVTPGAAQSQAGSTDRSPIEWEDIARQLFAVDGNGFWEDRTPLQEEAYTIRAKAVVALYASNPVTSTDGEAS